MKKIVLMILMTFSIFAQEFIRIEKISGIKEVSVNGAATINLIKDSKETLTFIGKESIVSKISIKVRGSYLEIKMPKKSYFGFDDNVVININLEQLEDFEFEGTGDVFMSDFKMDKFSIKMEGTGNGKLTNNDIKDLNIEINGKSNMEVEGKVEKLSAYVDGIGSLKAFGLEAENGDIKLNGIGSVEVNVEKKLSAEVNGIGKIIYKGNPSLEKTKLNGLGQIKKYEE